MIIDEDMWIEVGLQLSDPSCLLTRQSRVIAVWIIVGRKLALQILDPVYIVARENKQIRFLENFRSPLGLSGKLPQQRQHAFITSWFIAVLTTLNENAQLCAIEIAV